MTDVTVVTPTRDRAEILLAHALPSALAQEDVSFELVVVDDGSTDDTASWLAELGDERVRVVRHEASRGTAAARNAGIAAARGDWVAFLDDDDLWAPTYLRRMLDAAGDAGWVYCAGVVVDGAGDVVDTLVAADPTTVRTAIRHGNVVGGGSALLARTDLLRRLGGLDETLVYVEDWDLCIRLADAAPAAACHEQLVATLDHQARALFRDPDAVAASIERLLARHGGTAADRQAAAEWLANQHHRAGHRLAASRLYLRAAVRHRAPGNLPPALGALFGRAGMRVAAKLLTAARGDSHLDLDRHPPPARPDWLGRQ